jgi:D-alanine-D-alanine ligase-like ATP-grasp enzyme
MSEAAVIILFCEGFEAGDVGMHEDLLRQFDPELAVHSFVLRDLEDLRAARACAACYIDVVVWNNYWPDDAIAEAVAQEFIGAIVGSNLAITRVTTRKSTTYRRLIDSGLDTPWFRVVTSPWGLAALAPIPFPVIVKPDAGYDTTGMGETSLCGSLAELEREVARLTGLGHDAIVVQRFLAGREFTVPYANHRAFCPVEKVFPAARNFYLSGQPYEKRRCGDDGLETAVRTLARRTGRAFGFARTEYCRIDIREDPDSGDLHVIDVNDMCSIYPNGQFETGLAADGLPRGALAHWLTAPPRLARFARETVIYLPFHKDLSQVENLIPFLRAFRCKVFLYEWADASREMFAWFSQFPRTEVSWFSIDALNRAFAAERGDGVVLFTDTPNYEPTLGLGDFFAVAREYFPAIVDVVSIGHCMSHSSCDSRCSDIGDIPIKYTAWHNGLLPFDTDELRRLYRIDERTVMVSPTTGDDRILLARHDILRELKALQDEGRFTFLFKLHPSTEMMAFDDIWFQAEKQGYAYVREHFRRVAPRHFSIFAFTALVRIHVVDLYSSMPAMLTAFEGLTVVALDNPMVADDHPLRAHLQVVRDPASLRAAIIGESPACARSGPDYWRAHYPPVTGTEVLSVALERGWLEHSRTRHATPAADPRGFRRHIESIAAEVRIRHADGRASNDEFESAVYYFERPLVADALDVQLPTVVGST